MTDMNEPGDDEVRAETDPTRKAILAAMQRILRQCPRQVPVGATGIRDLAAEAEVGRHYLYQRHVDLRDRFRFLTRRENGINLDQARERLSSGQAEIRRMKALQQRTRGEALRWKATCAVLQRAINVLQEELRQERSKTTRLTRKLDSGAAATPNPLVLLRASPVED